eukprot:TRINITY_DN2650_c0_g1_i2.p2 TRINITY_DN2650_c0_g1~~TRINITY_DN2650_c0_g1_i2.p2  ORF type:complete len:114 (-),score=24.51 TRINITY_DN2650_c0_g1_i2:537-878(-)
MMNLLFMNSSGRTESINLGEPGNYILENFFCPLFGISKKQLISSQSEIIFVLDAVHELSSRTFQRRWSYLPDEIFFNHEFVPMLCREKDVFVVDHSLLSATRRVETVEEEVQT